VSTASAVVNGLHQAAVGVVPPTTVQGMRKVKHIRISLSPEGTGPEGAAQSDVTWALVYVPEGYNPNNLDGLNEHSLYEPNQFVMAAGHCDPNAGPVRISSPISRNLNSGDYIVLVIGTMVQQQIRGVVEYAITLQ